MKKYEKTPTKVINLIGGSGAGKSTTAAGLYAEMKLCGIECELTREWVKIWAYQGKKIEQLDQPYIFANQSRLESELYGMVPYLITDSPILLQPAYELFYNKDSITKETVFRYLDKAKSQGVSHEYIFLNRCKPFHGIGRYETEEQAKAFDIFLHDRLNEWGIPFTVLSVEDRERVPTIMEMLGLGPTVKSGSV